MDPKDLGTDQVRQGRHVNWIVRVLVVSLTLVVIGLGLEALIVR